MNKIDAIVKSQLQELGKENGNNRCVDCDAYSPQWASPKLGIYICLSCAGVHRSLGVQISFVRSITMDNFKPAELAKMKAGGNDKWREFFNTYKDNVLEVRTFDECTIKERYDSKAAAEWRERLMAMVENREFDPAVLLAKPTSVQKLQDTLSPTGSPLPTPITALRSSTSHSGSSRPSSPALGTSSLLGGSGGGHTKGGNLQMNLPGVNDFQKNPVMALTMGLGWLGATVSKSAKEGIDDWVKPSVQKLAETDISAAAQQAASQINQGIQTGTRSAADVFNRLVEGDSSAPNEAQQRGGMEGLSNSWVDGFNNLNDNLSKTGQSLWGSLAPAFSGVTERNTTLGPSFSSQQGRYSSTETGEESLLVSDESLLNPAYHAAPVDTLAMARAPSPPPPKAKTQPKAKKQNVDFWDEFGMPEVAKGGPPIKRKPKAKDEVAE